MMITSEKATQKSITCSRRSVHQESFLWALCQEPILSQPRASQEPDRRRAGAGMGRPVPESRISFPALYAFGAGVNPTNHVVSSVLNIVVAALIAVWAPCTSPLPFGLAMPNSSPTAIANLEPGDRRRAGRSSTLLDPRTIRRGVAPLYLDEVVELWLKIGGFR